MKVTFKQAVEYLEYHTKENHYYNAMLWFEIVCRYAKNEIIIQLNDWFKRVTSTAFNYLANYEHH